MTDLQTLLQQRAQLDAEIARQKPQAVAQVVELMRALDVTLQEVEAVVAPRRAAAGAGAKRPVKYRDDKGNTWTGVGQRPRWLVTALQAGATLDQFRVR